MSLALRKADGFARDELTRAMLVIVACAWIASLFVPLSTTPSVAYPISSGVPKWQFVIWPAIAASILLACKNAHVLLVVAVTAIVTYADDTLSAVGFGSLIAGLILLSNACGVAARPGKPGLAIDLGSAPSGSRERARRDHDTARIFIAVGAGMLLPASIAHLRHLSPVSMPHVAMLLLGVVCGALALVPTAIDACRARRLAVAFLAWLPLHVVMTAVVKLALFDRDGDALLEMTHALIHTIAGYGVLAVACASLGRRASRLTSAAG